MAHTRPFKRNARPFTDGSYKNGGKGLYLRELNYADDGRRYIRAALLLQRDLLRIFEFVEPDEKNFECYSIRIHELIVLANIEIEANFKAILLENGYVTGNYWNMADYRKIESTHFLSKYRVKIPDFSNPNYIFQPFKDWEKSKHPRWHESYNVAKHDRHKKFSAANFRTLLEAMGALFIVLASQFHTENLQDSNDVLGFNMGKTDGFEVVAGGLFRIEFPQDWPDAERYDFQHSDITDVPEFFQSLNYK